MKLSILDLIPVRTGQHSGDAVAATVSLARAADAGGFHRYWVAEHHNAPAVASTSPAVILAVLAARTQRIRLGSGGVMLPNHAPLVVAEQFALLEATFPGRIDLGLGRAPGTDPVTSWALRSSAGRDDRDLEQFSQILDEVAALLDGRGVRVPLRGREHILRATPKAASTPALWLLGSSMYSAHLAAAKGLPYVFAHHFSGQGTAQALATYREEFQPSAQCPSPTTFLTANVVVAQTADEARALALPNAQSMARLRTGRTMTPVDLVEDAAEATLEPDVAHMSEAILERMIAGTPDTVHRRLAELAQDFAVDEVMLNVVTGEYRGTDPATSPNRLRSLELLAQMVP